MRLRRPYTTAHSNLELDCDYLFLDFLCTGGADAAGFIFLRVRGREGGTGGLGSGGRVGGIGGSFFFEHSPRLQTQEELLLAAPSRTNDESDA